ncbi:hypothetical protein [Bacillus dakarensis]|uniref:hypothetical protein n=1 Tax=Robertmurraya dakarensis TaxID=1926278 RepID=UPI000981F2F0|nr:hypothetical protein [Bacillus dakarensis]
MNWTMMILVQISVWAIVFFDWKKLKQSTKKEKIVIASILGISIVLSLFNLEHIPGLVTVFETIFKPLGKMLEV